MKKNDIFYSVGSCTNHAIDVSVLVKGSNY